MCAFFFCFVFFLQASEGKREASEERQTCATGKGVPRPLRTCLSLPRSRFLDDTQRSPKRTGGALRNIQKAAARETTLAFRSLFHRWVQFYRWAAFINKRVSSWKREIRIHIFLCVCKANVFRSREKYFTNLPVFLLRFPFSPSLITGFFALPMVHLSKIFSNNLFELLINLSSPRCPEVYVVNNFCSCYICTCRTKIQSEIIIQIRTLLRAIFKNW